MTMYWPRYPRAWYVSLYRTRPERADQRGSHFAPRTVDVVTQRSGNQHHSALRQLFFPQHNVRIDLRDEGGRA